MLSELLRKCTLRRAGHVHPTTRARRTWRLLELEDRTVPAPLGIGYVTGSGPGIVGVGNQVHIYDTTGELRFSFDAYPGFLGGANVALADVNGDGIADVITGAGPGGTPHVKVFDGATLQAATDPTDPTGQATAQNAVDFPLKSFFAYATTLRTGVNVAGGNITGEADPLNPAVPRGEIVTGPGTGGGSEVKVFAFDGNGGNGPLFDFYSYDPSLACGATVATGNAGGDIGVPPPATRVFPSDELITGAGFGGGPHVKIYSISLTVPQTLDTLGQFYAYDPSFFGGISVACGNVTKNLDTSLPPADPRANVPFDDIITGAEFFGTPNVKIFRLDDGRNPVPGFQFNYVLAASFNAYDPSFNGGVHVAVTGNLDGSADGTDDFMTGPGPGGGPDIRFWSGKALSDLQTYSPTQYTSNKYAYDSNFIGGVSVA